MTITERNKGRNKAMSEMLNDGKIEQKKAYYIKKRQNNASWFIEGYKLLTNTEYNNLIEWRNKNIESYEEFKVKEVSIKKYNNNPNKQLN